MSALLNCPFCGSVPRYLPRALTVHCANCNASPPKTRQDEAIAAWNRRTPPTLPTREEIIAVMDKALPPEPRMYDIHDAADAVLRLLGGEKG